MTDEEDRYQCICEVCGIIMRGPKNSLVAHEGVRHLKAMGDGHHCKTTLIEGVSPYEGQLKRWNAKYLQKREKRRG